MSRLFLEQAAHQLHSFISPFLQLLRHEVELLLAVLGQLAAAVLRLLDQTHLLQVVDAVADEVAVGLFHQSYLKMAYVIMVSMAHAVAVLGTEGISQGVNTAGSHVEVASDGS